MRICFICGSLEPGKDGVGDYAWILANALATLGAKPGILALNDCFIDRDKTEDATISSLRLSKKNSWHKNLQKAREWIEMFNPDHIVWQFVIYAFHPKGLPFWSLYGISALLKNYPNVSFMFHELWIGTDKNDKLSRRITGKIQHWMIKQLIRRVNPKFTFTSNRTYQQMLETMHLEAILLPLFSNIPYVPKADALFKKYLDEHRIEVPKGTLKIGLFSRIPWSWQLEPFLTQLKKTCACRPVWIFTAGRSDQMPADRLEEIFKQRLPNIGFVKVGEQPADIISGFLQYVDCGITMNSTETIGKSGVFSAYYEHGLPTILGGNIGNFGIPSSDVDHYVNHMAIKIDENLYDNLRSLSKLPGKTRSKETALKFLSCLNMRISNAK